MAQPDLALRTTRNGLFSHYVVAGSKNPPPLGVGSVKITAAWCRIASRKYQRWESGGGKSASETNEMNEKEKMLAGKLYDPSDAELVALRQKAHRLSAEYNALLETDARREEIMKELGIQGEGFYFQGPVQFDYGCFTTVGNGSFANFNFTCLDVCPVTIGDNVFMGSNVSILTPVHPMRWQERNMFQKEDGTWTDHEYAKPITIQDNCWIAGNVTICGGVTIGEGCVIGAGSVVTRDIPANSFAAGVPCRVIREITEDDKMPEDA